MSCTYGILGRIASDRGMDGKRDKQDKKVNQMGISKQFRTPPGDRLISLEAEETKSGPLSLKDPLS